MGDPDFDDDTVVVRTDEPLSATLDDEAVLLEPEEGVYYGMNEVGTALWDRIDEAEPERVADLREWMLETFDVEASVADRDLKGFLAELQAANLIETRDHDAS